MHEKILIVGAVRNVEKTILQDVLNFSLAFKKFDPHFFLVESDSSDATLEKLDVLRKKLTKFEYASLGNLIPTYTKRTERLAACRNFYLELIKNEKLYPEAGLVCVADFDNVNRLINSSSLEWLSIPKDWDVCTANTNQVYFDIFALRHGTHNNSCPKKNERFYSKIGKTCLQAKYLSSWSKMIHIPSNVDWIRVRSAFGGCSIYKRSSFKDARYSGLDKHGNEVCEHVYLHDQICRSGGKIYIVPSFVTTGWTLHSLPAHRISKIIISIVLWVETLLSIDFLQLIRFLRPRRR